MIYMIIEHFHPGKLAEVYQRVDEKGRMFPDGVKYINSWIHEDLTICYQVMEADSPDKLNAWINNWSDLVDFQVIPVISSAEARGKVLGK